MKFFLEIGAKWKGIFSILCIFSTLCIFIYLIDKANYAMPDKPSITQMEHINKAISLICEIDSASCNALQQKNIIYQVRNFSEYFNIFKYIWIFHNANVYWEDTSKYELTLSSHLFDDLMALTVLLYHEVQHIRFSDNTLYLDGADNQLQCLDHNGVKSKTSEFAVQLEQWLQAEQRLGYSVVKDPGFYAGLYGNKQEDCSKYTES